MADVPKSLKRFSYCLLSNIPENFHSGDLRNYFAVFTEANKFDLFHFRHRPQTVNITASASATSTEDTKNEVVSRKKFCCLVRFTKEKTALEFIRKYSLKLWMDKGGNELPSKVFISKVDLSCEDLVKFQGKELSPPAIMPKGNIGTPNQHFLNLIKQCKLPPSLIKKLGLEFPRGRVFKKYSNVPFDYGTSTRGRRENDPEEDEDDEIRDAKGRLLSSIGDPGKDDSHKKTDDDAQDSDKESNANDDDDGCEEWERHEALNEHRTSHGTMFDEDKERLYEEKIELKWEKGGSGLVFYTDAQFWEAQEEDHDDWDVDMEGYYVPGGGDKDAKDYLEMRQSERFQQGIEHISVFTKPPPPLFRPSSPPPGPSTSSGGNPDRIGSFEKHTRGIGRKIMEQSGWKDGQGLGHSAPGIAAAFGNEGLGPWDKRGLGFYGEKLEFTTRAEKNKRKKFGDYCLDPDAPERIVIGTVYDKPEDLDVSEPLKRRNVTTFIKRYEFVKGGKEQDTE